MSGKNSLELYLHIPFCVRKCLYCDFLSEAAAPETVEKYLGALRQEIIGRAEEACGRPVSSIFIGGGTPSLLSGQQVNLLMDTIRTCFSLEEGAEISMEANPGTVDLEKLCAYKSAGINRLSIGLQSADDEELKTLGRIHSFAQFQETYENALKAGFSNINIDVMSALPGQSLASYLNTLDRVLSFAPAHISAYSLIVEEGTPFWELAKKDCLDLPDEDAERLMYHETKRILQERGYHRYEISNYAKEGFACRHNCGYWERRDYLGFGIGAASLVENMRFSNGSNLEKYLERPLECRQEVFVLTVKEQMEEFMFLGLRMIKGVSPKEFHEQFGVSMREVYGTVISRNIEDGLLSFRWGKKEERLALTERGLDLSNYCMAQFLLS